MRYLAILCSVGLVLGSSLSAQTVPSDLSQLAAKSALQSPVVGWCSGANGVGGGGAYAIAIGSAGGLGRYLVLKLDGSVVELANFRSGAHLSCYTPAEAKKVSITISRSETIEGRITPRWSTTVVCGFVDGATSVCWQYSPVDSKFVRVGGWTT